MTAEAIVTGRRHAGWSLGERATVFGHVAEAHRIGHWISVAARTSGIAWLALWAKLTGTTRMA
jgi:hypothetical protein